MNKGKNLKNKIVSLLLCILMIFSVAPINVYAATEYSYGLYKYTVSGSNATIISYDETATGDVVIPSIINGKTVTAIGESAFYGCTMIESVTIPNTVISIGDYAFAFCISLRSVYIPESVISMGKNVFQNSNLVNFSEDILKEVSFQIKDYKPGKMTLNFKSSYFEKDSINYNHNLGRLTSQLVTLGYSYSDYSYDKNENDGKKYKNASDDEIKAAKKHSTFLDSALQSLGLGNIEMNMSASRNQENYFIGNRKIHTGGQEYNLIVVGLIGSHSHQWNSNFDPLGVDSGIEHSDYVKEYYHTGFYDAKEYVKSKLNSYISSNKLNNKNNTKILICGHSRGAAASNLLAYDLMYSEEYAYKFNIYTYAFATPNSTPKDLTNSTDYDRIFNIVNPEDFVTKVLPNEWGYARIGKTFVLPSKTNETKNYNKKYLPNMLKQFSKLCPGAEYNSYEGEHITNGVVNHMVGFLNVPKNSRKSAMDAYYSPNTKNNDSYFSYFQNIICPWVNNDGGDYKKTVQYGLSTNVYGEITRFFAFSEELRGKQFTDAHCAQTYCAYMLSLTKEELIDSNRKVRSARVNCPVDIEIYDKETGELVGRIVDNVVDETVASKENAVVMSVDGDSKQFWLPSDGDYDIKLIGNDDGKMDYSISEINEDAVTTQKLNFFDVKIENGKTYTADVSSDEELDEYTIVSPTGEEVNPSENMANEEIVYYNITTSVEGNGIATESMNVESGSYVTLTAEPDEGNTFIGWYDGSTLISSEKTYSFVAKGDVSYKAKFEAATIKSVKIDDITINYKSSYTLQPIIENDNAKISKIEYSSSNTNVATVDQNGNVYGAKRGEATITCKVTDENGNTVSDTCKVTVSYAWWQWLIKILLFGWIWY